MTAEDEALVALLQALKARDYRFVTPTPDTHRKMLWRLFQGGRHTLRDVFGWNRPFRSGDVDSEILDLMRAGGVLAERGQRLSSKVRVASLGEDLFLHSGFPPRARDAVFLGPDSYRFADFLRAELGPARRIVDIGAGAGVGGIAAARVCPQAAIVLADINPQALRLARINAAAAVVSAEIVESDGLAKVIGPFDTAIANPPYLRGSGGRTYRDGGDLLGARLSLDWARAALARLPAGGRLLLYTGSAIVEGRDRLKAELETLATEQGASLRYREIDPDVFGGMLLHPAYRRVDRIAAVGAVMEMGGNASPA
ncbi:methyltransferase [Phenylobacterium sp.]|uniref:methyltransferase n=1 Tax=Phenylobacterium sp. TaxID=1871053 RepID=UPI00271AFBBA|nr:methyltransferase [Phenylobacterium sp.]MDO8379250.1 methyltransferase [Phenylobacterium sp.]